MSTPLSALNEQDLDQDQDMFDGEEFIVEKILAHKYEMGRKYYLIKWLGFADQDTWEPEEHLAECPELLSEYRNHEVEIPSEFGPFPLDENQENEDPEDDIPRIGFRRGLEPHKILGATTIGGDFGFLIKWKGCDHADIVDRKEANVKCPQLVIKFYQDRIMWGQRTLADILGENEPIVDETGAEI